MIEKKLVKMLTCYEFKPTKSPPIHMDESKTEQTLIVVLKLAMVLGSNLNSIILCAQTLLACFSMLHGKAFKFVKLFPVMTD